MVRRVIELYLISVFKYHAFQQSRVTSRAVPYSSVDQWTSMLISAESSWLNLELLGVTSYDRELDTTKLADYGIITVRFSSKSQVRIL